jgi:putative transposase
MPKSRGRRAAEGTNARRNIVVAARIPVARTAAPDLSRVAAVRLEMIDWHRTHGADVSLTARHFGFSRPTVYRWLGRFEAHRLESLEDRSDRPLRRRRPTWTPAQLEAVKVARQAHPRWGKDKLVVLLRRAGHRLSTSMVGRILVRLRRTGELRERRVRRTGVRRRTWLRPWAVRTPAGHRARLPGDLVQVDTLDVWFPGHDHPFKQFTARDVVSRWDTLELRRSATAASAVGILDALAERMPFPVRAISIDNGSEFMADFERACADRRIPLFVLPPRSPKLHGAVERANRTHTEEFYEVTDAEPDLASLQSALREWEEVYNTVRPHQALRYLTPAEFLASLG